jgi:hypothetical protein
VKMARRAFGGGRLTVVQVDVASSSPASGPGPIRGRDWRIAAGLAACILGVICAYRWAMPGNSRSLGMQLTGPLMGTILISSAWHWRLEFERPNAGFRKRTALILTWGVFLRACLALLVVYLLVELVEAVPAADWPGGWALGAAGLVVGALAGAASGWLQYLIAGPLVTMWYAAEPRAAVEADREPGSS